MTHQQLKIVRFDLCLCLVTQSCPTLCDPVDCSPPGSSVHGDSPGKNTGVGCHALLQGIFLTQGLILALQVDSSPSEATLKMFSILFLFTICGCYNDRIGRIKLFNFEMKVSKQLCKYWATQEF